MIKKKLLLTLFFSIIFLSLISQVDSFFFRDHQYAVLKAFELSSSPLAEQCRPHIEAVLTGTEAADVGVIHYFDDKVSSYIGTHQRVGYENCLSMAGSDIESRCFCHGISLHIVVDALSHLDGGIVVENIRKSFGSNFLGHMVVERSMEKKHEVFLRKTSDPILSQVDFFDKRVLNMMFEFNQAGEITGPSKFMSLINEASGIDMEQDALTIRAGYLSQGFFDTAYKKEKLVLPFWAWGIGIGAIIIGFTVALTLIIFGKTKFKFIASILWFGVGIIGIIIIYSFLTATTWQITLFLIEAPASVGYLMVSDQDVQFYHDALIQNSVRFLDTEILSIDDASGLSFVDQNGFFHEGALKRAQGPFNTILLPIMVLMLLIFSIWSFLKSFKIKTPKILNIAGTGIGIFFGLIILLFIVGMIINIFI